MSDRHFKEENTRVISKYKKMLNLTSNQEKEKLEQQ